MFKKIYDINPLTPELNPFAQRCLTRFLLRILLLEPWISLMYAWKANKYNIYSFSLLIIYGNSYMFRHYIAIFREHSLCLLRDALLAFFSFLAGAFAYVSYLSVSPLVCLCESARPPLDRNRCKLILGLIWKYFKKSLFFLNRTF
jgi:hypothetical protein